MESQRPWHRLFGLTWMDFFRGLPVEVILEKDLSLKQQLLDVVILRTAATPLPCQLPDGFETLTRHNLITFKSFQETLDGWTLLELLGHYVNYRKQVSPTMNDLLPEADFRLYAVCVRFPQGLAAQMPLREVRPGVYEVSHYTGVVRVIVVHQLVEQDQNALLHLFSARQEQVRFGQADYELRSPETTTLLYQLYERYREEGWIMPDALQQLYRETVDKLLRELPPEDLVKYLPPAERLKGLPAEDRLKGLPAEDRLKGLPAEDRVKGLPAEERLKGLTNEEILAALPPTFSRRFAIRAKARPTANNGYLPSFYPTKTPLLKSVVWARNAATCWSVAASKTFTCGPPPGPALVLMSRLPLSV